MIRKIIGWMIIAVLAVGLFLMLAATHGFCVTITAIGVSICFVGLLLLAMWLIMERS